MFNLVHPNSYIEYNILTLKVLVTTIDAQWEGMGIREKHIGIQIAQHHMKWNL